mgnify:CR=1 FL=1
MFTKTDTLKTKGIAMLLLLFHHLFYSNSVYETRDIDVMFLSRDVVQQIAIGARVCVWIFAFLSAYGLTHSYYEAKANNIDTVTFLKKRWVSLMKPYWFMYIIFFLLSFVLFRNPLEVYQNNIIYLLFDFFAVADFFGTPMLSAVWWYMCFAQVLLFMIPLLAEFCNKFSSASCIIIFIILQYIGSGIHSPYGGMYTNYLLAIVLAVVCARNKKLLGGVKTKSFMLQILEIVGLILLICGCIYIKNIYGADDTVKITTLLSGIAVLALCTLVHKYITNSFIEKILVFLGNHSGNIFMMHWFIYAYYPDVIYYSKNVIISWLCLLAISVIVSMLIEKVKELVRYNKFIKLVFKF